jgi:hypothetical protein
MRIGVAIDLFPVTLFVENDLRSHGSRIPIECDEAEGAILGEAAFARVMRDDEFILDIGRDAEIAAFAKRNTYIPDINSMFACGGCEFDFKFPALRCAHFFLPKNTEAFNVGSTI